MRNILIASLLVTVSSTAFANAITPYPQQAAGKPLASTKVSATDVENNLITAATNKVNSLKSKLPAWLQRIDFNVAIAQHQKPTWYVKTIQPLFERTYNVIFTQDQLSRQGNNTTSNIGFGYRHLLHNNSWIFGANTFFDKEWRYNHKRIGFGAEAIGQYATLRGNYYDAISSRKKVGTVNGVTEYQRALSGYDFGAEVPVPYLPWASLDYNRYFWWRRYGVSNIKGFKAGIAMNPTGSFEVETGVSNDNASKRSFYLDVGFHFGQPPSVEYALTSTPYSKSFLTKRNLRQHMLDYVKRQNKIIVQTTEQGSDGIIVARGT
jgi:hypothetical protein